MTQRTGRPAAVVRRIAAAVAAAAAVLALPACGALTSPAQRDAGFVHEVRTAGGAVPTGADQEETLVAAAQKICNRREYRETVEERHAYALTSRELDTVVRTFAADPRRFATLAVATYCP